MYLNNPKRCTLIMHAVSVTLVREKRYFRKDETLDVQGCITNIYINNMNINDMFISEDGMGHFDGNGKQLMTLQVDNV